MMSRRLAPSLVLSLLLGACGSDEVSTGGRTPTSPISSQVASVVITPETILLAPGDTTRLVAATRDAGGAPLLGRVVAWSSESPAIATVSSSGLVTVVAVGNVRITATSEGRSGTATITAVR